MAGTDNELEKGTHVAQMRRLRIEWSGSGVAGPGLTTLFAGTVGTGFPAAAKALLQSQLAAFPAGTSIFIPNDGDLIEATTGALAGSWSEPSGGGTLTGTGVGEYAKGVGMQIRWKTGGIVAGRRVQGSTFFVPVMGAIFDTNGTIDDATVTSLTTAATTYLGGSFGAVVWSRPNASRPGSSHTITSAAVPDRPSWLRSRRS